MRFNYVVEESQENKKLGSVLQNQCLFGSGRIAKLKRVENGIVVNGKQTFTDYRVQKGDIISVLLDDISGENPAPPVPIPLELLYEDEYLAVLNKQAGLATQGPPESGTFTVASALSYLWGRKQVFHPVNRLDKGTSGIMVIAKNGYVHDILRNQLHTDNFVRNYIAVVEGTPHPPIHIINSPILRKEGNTLMRVVSCQGQESRTAYRVISTDSIRSVLFVTPYTGRTHQIRVHLASIGHAIVGDWMYGKENKELISRPALHSYKVNFLHPITKKVITLRAPVPEDMKSLVADFYTSFDEIE